MKPTLFLAFVLFTFVATPFSSHAQQTVGVFTAATGEAQFKVEAADYNVIISREGRLVGYSVRSTGDFDYDVHGRLEGVGDIEISYDIHRRIDGIGSDEFSYDIHGRLDEIGNIELAYDIHNRIVRIGKQQVSYNLDGRITRVR